MDNDNLDNFFNNKLNNFDDSTDGWDKLGRRPFDMAQTAMITSKKSTFSHISTFVIIGLIITVLSIGRYSIYLNKKVENLETQLSEKIVAISVEETSTSNEVTSLAKIDKLEKQVLYLKKIIQNLESNNHDLTNQSKKQTNYSKTENINFEATTNTIIKTEKNLNRPNNRLQYTKIKETETDTQTIDNHLINNHFNSITTNKTPSLLTDLLDAKSFLVKAKNTSNLNFEYPNVSKISSLQKRYGFGYEFSIFEIELPSEKDFDYYEDDDDDNDKYDHDDEIILLTHGLTTNFYLRPNIRLFTGFRIGKTTLNPNYQLNMKYDKLREYTNTNGELASDFTLMSTTVFGETSTDITMTFPNGNGLDNGDVLLTDLVETQTLQYVQVPVGVEYLFGQNKFKWFCQAGLQYNQVRLINYTINAEATSGTTPIDIENLKTLINNTNNESISFFGGLGVSYQLTPNWAVRTNLNYNFNWNKKQIHQRKYRIRESLSQGLNIGLNYRL